MPERVGGEWNFDSSNSKPSFGSVGRADSRSACGEPTATLSTAYTPLTKFRLLMPSETYRGGAVAENDPPGTAVRRLYGRFIDPLLRMYARRSASRARARQWRWPAPGAGAQCSVSSDMTTSVAGRGSVIVLSFCPRALSAAASERDRDVIRAQRGEIDRAPVQPCLLHRLDALIG